jgi:hypothetical protein
MGQGVVAGPTQGFGAAFGSAIEGTPFAADLVDVGRHFPPTALATNPPTPLLSPGMCERPPARLIFPAASAPH